MGNYNMERLCRLVLCIHDEFPVRPIIGVIGYPVPVALRPAIQTLRVQSGFPCHHSQAEPAPAAPRKVTGSPYQHAGL